MDEQALTTILLRDTSLSRDMLDSAMDIQGREGGTLAEILRREGVLPEEELLRAQAMQLGVEYLSGSALDPTVVDDELLAAIPINYAKAHCVLPLHRDEGLIKVVMSDPAALHAIDDLRTMFDAEIAPVLATSEAVVDLINKSYARQAKGVDLEANDEFRGDAEELIDIIDSTDEAPIIRWVNSLIFQAIKERASDIHIEPGEREVMVRYRIDGVLYEVRRANRSHSASIAARVKIMAGLNIAEKRLPQDGRIRRRIAGKDIDMRVATAPTTHGEDIVIRLLDKTAVLLDLSEIGLIKEHLSKLSELIRRPHGIILVSGPTGSGKTTTLYSALTEINEPDKKILTIEDPVEYQIGGISQTQVNEKIDLTFANGLRSFLRRDPDVIMVGEIRDPQTAEIAIQASLTGHLVLSTIHTNDAAGAVTRLVEMNVEPFLVASSVLAMVAQRLVRKVCPECKALRRPTAEELVGFGMTTEQFDAASGKDYGFNDPRRPAPPAGMVYQAKGCGACLNTGYAGRIGIYELMPMTDGIRAMVLKDTDSNTIKRAAVDEGMLTLRMDGIRKVLSGLTTVEEVMRVTQEDVI